MSDNQVRRPLLTRTMSLAAVVCLLSMQATASVRAADPAPTPRLDATHSVDWWFVFKLNASKFPGCDGGASVSCPFGGTDQHYKYDGQQFLYASSSNDVLTDGGDCLGDSTMDPLGATFDEVYNGPFHYVVWNDQFYGDPMPSRAAPWGHAKGMLAWGDTGEGFVLQVTTPSWPASGNAAHPRTTDGNSLGCVDDNNVQVSQHFFSLRLTKDDVIAVLRALANASVVTDIEDKQVVSNGGPSDIQALVQTLGARSSSKTPIVHTLSSGVVLISKPSALHVPPWQLVSAELGGVALRTATWWSAPAIPSTTEDSHIACWDASLPASGPVEVATSGAWDGTAFSLKGSPSANGNHAKIGVSTSGTHDYVIFGDENQQGTLSGPTCASSQNGRGGLFYVLDDTPLWKDVSALLAGETAPTK